MENKKEEDLLKDMNKNDEIQLETLKSDTTKIQNEAEVSSTAISAKSNSPEKKENINEILNGQPDHQKRNISITSKRNHSSAFNIPAEPTSEELSRKLLKK